MNFKNADLEATFRSFKYARNNTIDIFEEAEKQNLLSFKPGDKSKDGKDFQDILFQFLCVITTTDAYIRKITDAKDKRYGILIRNGQVIPKNEIDKLEVKILLEEPIRSLEELLKPFDNIKTEENLRYLITIINHDYLHQGQLILMFRLAGANLPERFVKAWALYKFKYYQFPASPSEARRANIKYQN